MKIAFIGAGNVAWHLSAALDNAGYPVVTVYSRQLSHAQQVAERLFNASAVDRLDFRRSEANLFLLCVPDDALAAVLTDLQVPPCGILVHTSGTRPLTALLEWRKNVPDWSVGVFYPLQTFTRGVPMVLEEVPICVEASDEETETQLIELAQRISRTVYTVDSEERKVLHLAAVVAGNFSNHLWAVAKELLDESQLDFDLLKPLLNETFRKAMHASHPADVQTGPARRGDLQTLEAHLDLLKGHPDLQNIYKVLSLHIRKWYE